MNLIKVQPGPYFEAKCLDCGVPFDINTGFADTEGPAFRAYYCVQCGNTKILLLQRKTTS